MNATQKLFKRQFTFIQGLHTTLKVTIESWIPDYLQIFQGPLDYIDHDGV